MTADTLLPAILPISTISDASSFVLSRSPSNEPSPVFTSSTNISAATASFLLIMLEAISGIESTVPVTSRRAYKILSAGQIFPVCPQTAIEMSFTCFINSSFSKKTLSPSNDSSLSSVPPVKPSPRPLIFATLNPSAAKIGIVTKVVESPTPPVECLSTVVPFISEKSKTSPLFFIASVK